MQTPWLVAAGTMLAAAAAAAQTFPPPHYPGELRGRVLVRSIDEQETDPARRAEMHQHAARLQSQQLMLVPDKQIGDFEAVADMYLRSGRTLPLALAREELYLLPSDVSGTILREAEEVGAMPEGSQVGKAWIGISRLFRHPQLGWVLLDESDLLGNGGGMALTREFLNAEVQGGYAVLTSQRSQENPRRGVTRLQWFAGGIMHELTTPASDAATRAALLEIANGLHPMALPLSAPTNASSGPVPVFPCWITQLEAVEGGVRVAFAAGTTPQVLGMPGDSGLAPAADGSLLLHPGAHAHVANGQHGSCDITATRKFGQPGVAVSKRLARRNPLASTVDEFVAAAPLRAKH